MAETSVEAATIADMRLAKARFDAALEDVKATDIAVRKFGASLDVYRLARVAYEKAKDALDAVVEAVPAHEFNQFVEENDSAPFKASCPADDMVMLSRGTDVIILSTNEAERLLAELPALIKMAEG